MSVYMYSWRPHASNTGWQHSSVGNGWPPQHGCKRHLKSSPTTHGIMPTALWIAQQRVLVVQHHCAAAAPCHPVALHAHPACHWRLGDASLLLVVFVTLSVKLSCWLSSSRVLRRPLPLDCALGGRRSFPLRKSAPDPDAPLHSHAAATLPTLICCSIDDMYHRSCATRCWCSKPCDQSLARTHPNRHEGQHTMWCVLCHCAVLPSANQALCLQTTHREGGWCWLEAA